MKLFFSICILFLAYTFGSFVGYAAELNSTATGLVAAGLSLFAKSPTGSLRAGLDASQVVAQLGQYIEFHKKEIWAAIRQGVELHQYMTGIGGVRGKWSGLSASANELHQPWQSGFQAKGTASLTPLINESFHVKVDMLIDNIDTLYNGYTDFLTKENTTRDKWPFVTYIITNVLIPKMIEEINIMSCVGVRAAVAVPGTAGGYLDCYNGLFTLVTNWITGGLLTPITVGSMTTANGVDKVETFLDSIPSKFKTKGGTIFTSVGKETAYKRNYRTLFGSTNDQKAKGQTQVDDSNINIIGLTGAGSANRMIFVPGNSKDRLVHFYNEIALPDGFDVQLDKRDVILLHDRWDGVGATTLDGMYASDVA